MGLNIRFTAFAALRPHLDNDMILIAGIAIILSGKIFARPQAKNPRNLPLKKGKAYFHPSVGAAVTRYREPKNKRRSEISRV